MTPKKPGVVFAALFLSSGLALAETLEPLVPLNQDPSRGALGEMAARMSHPEEVNTFGLGPPFVFPRDVKPDHLYGIDISHHTFSNGRKIEWKGLRGIGVLFVYMKASEGARYVDGTLQSSWTALRSANDPKNPILLGAYHFLSADIDPGAQAQTFVRVLKEKTDFAPGRDMAPAMDLEQDCWKDASGHVMYDAKGSCVGDYWSKYTPDQIAGKVAAWLTSVEKALKVKPVVYTNAQWWSSVKLGSSAFLKDYSIWIADYSRKANTSGKPGMPPGYDETIWQFSDNGKVDPSCDPSNKNSECIDSNVVRVDRATFEKAVGVSHK